jgi:hypothetical protein
LLIHSEGGRETVAKAVIESGKVIKYTFVYILTKDLSRAWSSCKLFKKLSHCICIIPRGLPKNLE